MNYEKYTKKIEELQTLREKVHEVEVELATRMGYFHQHINMMSRSDLETCPHKELVEIFIELQESFDAIYEGDDDEDKFMSPDEIRNSFKRFN